MVSRAARVPVLLVGLALVLAAPRARALQPLSLGVSRLSLSGDSSSSPAPIPPASSQVMVPYDVVGTLGTALIPIGMYYLGSIIDQRTGASAGPWSKAFFVVGMGIDFVGLKYLGDALGVPTTWASTAAGFGLGLATAGLFIAIDAGFIVGLGWNQNDVGTQVLAIVTVIAWAVATPIFISEDPFHLAHGTSLTKGVPQATSQPLISLSF